MTQVHRGGAIHSSQIAAAKHIACDVGMREVGERVKSGIVDRNEVGHGGFAKNDGAGIIADVDHRVGSYLGL